MIPIIILSILVVVIAALVVQNLIMTDKLKYYEETLLNHSGDFSEQKWQQILSTMSKKSWFDNVLLLIFKE